MYRGRFSVALAGLFLFFAVASASGEKQASRAAPESRKELVQADVAPKAKNSIPAPPADANDLALEVNVLRTVYLFQLSPDMVKTTRETGADCAQKPRKRFAAEVSDRYRKLLVEYREALLRGDEDRILDLSDQVEEVRKEEDPDIDDTVEITDEARKKAPGLLRNMNANRIVHYTSSYGKDFPNPYQIIRKTMRLSGKGKPPTAEEWKEQRDFVAKQVAWCYCGVDAAKSRKKAAEVAMLLDRANALSPEELEKQRDELEAAVRKLNAGTDGLDVIRNVLQQDIAEMISNPRFVAAMDARMKAAAK
jgi:hypothetical protein